MNKQTEIDFNPRFYVDYKIKETEPSDDDEFTIENVIFSKVSMSLSMFFFPISLRITVKNMDRILAYCIDRLMRIHRVYDTSLYEAEIRNGYYGPEINGINFKNKSALLDDVNRLFTLTTCIDRINFILEKEYSFVLDVLKDCTAASIVKYNLDKVGLNIGYIYRMKKTLKPYDFIDGKDIPVGIIHKDNLVDGYHRFVSLRDDNKKHAKFIVVE